MSSKLPPRLYYSLKQAAKELGCDEDYLIHMGGADMVEIMQFAEFDALAYPMLRFPLKCEDDPELADLLLLTYENPHGCFYVHTPDSIRRFELTGCEYAAVFLDILYPSMSREMYSAKSEYEATLEAIRKRLSIDARFLGFRMQPYSEASEDEPDSPASSVIFDEIHPPGFAYLRFDPDRIFIRQPEIERLLKGDIKAQTYSPEAEGLNLANHEPAPKRRNYYLRTIDALSRALTGTDLDHPKAAEAVLAKLSKAKIAAPLEAKALSGYLKEARELREEDTKKSE